MTSRTRIYYGAAFLTSSWLVLVLLAVLIWLASPMLGVVVALILLDTTWKWYCTIRVFRSQVFAAILPKQMLVARTLRWVVCLFHLGIVWVNITYIPFFWLTQMLPLRWLMASYTSVWLLFLFSRPPGILWLTTSSAKTVRLLAQIDRFFNSIGVVALLDTRKATPFHRIMTLGANYRTISDEAWESVVYRLMDLVPVIVVDTREPTDGVVREINNLLTRDLVFKTLFLGNPDHKFPALELVSQQYPLNHAMATTEMDVLSHLRFLVNNIPRDNK